MKRLLGIGIIVAALFGLARGSAAVPQLGGGTFPFNTHFDLTCTDRVDVAGWGLETSDGMVYNVRFEPLPQECYGNDIFVMITSYGVPIAGGRAQVGEDWNRRVRFGPVPAADITDLHILIGGWDPPEYPSVCPWTCYPFPQMGILTGTGLSRRAP
jgi:hypothetical protein